MLKLALAALLVGAASHSLAPPAPPPLCRVAAAAHASVIPWLYTITLTLRPDCPPDGVAYVQLVSDLGSTDPPNDWVALTPCLTSSLSCTISWRGVVLRPLGWRPQWRARNGRAYAIPLP